MHGKDSKDLVKASLGYVISDAVIYLAQHKTKGEERGEKGGGNALVFFLNPGEL